MLADYHMHSSFSEDSTYPMEAVILKAISEGLDEICFTEHIDYGMAAIVCCDSEAYYREFQRCAQLYGDRIALKFGIEYGIQTTTVPEFQKNFDAYPYDFVILSFHQVDSQEFWRQDFQRGKTQQEYNEQYYQEILKVMQIYDDYSVLGHLDVIRRYDEAGSYSSPAVDGIITEILSHAITHGKGIEVNTSSFRYGLADLTPSREILKRYRELGGTIITVGSDAHEEAHVGYKIQYIQDELKKLGYTHIYTFEKMKPLAHPL